MAKDDGLVRKPDAARIGKAVKKIEGMTRGNTGSLSTPVNNFLTIPAKITQIFDKGLYALKEQIVNLEGDGYEDKKSQPRIWDGDFEEGNLPQAFEISGNTELNINDIVFVYRQGPEGVSINRWVFDGGGASAATVGAKNHITTDKGQHQLVNDVKVGDAALLIDLGPSLYGELNQPLDANWRYLWDNGIPAQGFMIPQPGLGSGGEPDLTIQNLRQIRFQILQGQGGFYQLMVKHAKLPEAEGTNIFEMWDGHNAAGTGYYVINKAAFDALGPAVTLTTDNLPIELVRFDVFGHLMFIDDVYNSSGDDPDDSTPPVVSAGIEVAYTASTVFPATGSLWNVSVAQETRLTDGAGGDVVIVAANRIEWTIRVGWGRVIGGAINPANASNPTFKGDSTNYLAGKHGNRQNLNHDLSRVFNTTFQLEGTDVITGVVNTSDVIDTDTIYAEEPIFQATPSNGVSFDVFCFIANAAGGQQYTRWNGENTYRISADFFWKSEGLSVGTILETVTGNIVSFDGGNKSGAIISFTPQIDNTHESDQLCIDFKIEHFSGAVLAAEGFIFDSGGQFISAQNCSEVAGTNNYTATLTLSHSNIDVADSTEVKQGSTTMSDFGSNAIVATVTIFNNGVPTSDFSTAGNTITYSIGGKIFSDKSGNTSTQPVAAYQQIIAAGAVNGSDGFIFTIETIEGFPTSTGQLTVTASIQGIPNAATANFEIKNSDETFCWSDDFGAFIPVDVPTWTYRNQDAQNSNPTGNNYTNQGDRIEQGNFGAGGKFGEGWSFFFLEKSDVDGHRIQINWRLTDTPTLVRGMSTAHIVDGIVDNINDFSDTGDGSDFDHSTSGPTYPIISLFSISSDGSGSPVQETDMSSIINLNAFNEKVVTFQVWFRDAWDENINLQIISIKIFEANGTTLFRDLNIQNVLPQQTGTAGVSTYGNLIEGA